METFKKGDQVVVVLDEQSAQKHPSLDPGVEYPATVTCRMKATRVPSYRVSLNKFLEIQIPDAMVIRRAP